MDAPLDILSLWRQLSMREIINSLPPDTSFLCTNAVLNRMVQVDDVVTLEMVEGHLQIKDWANNYIDRGNLLENWSFLDFFLGTYCYKTSISISFLDYWQVTLIWSPYGDVSLIRSFTY